MLVETTRVLLALSLAFACPLARAQDAAPSVRPGINQPYFAEGALEKWGRVLEAESREVVKRRAAIVRALALRPGQSVADVGAGTGLFTFELAKRVGRTGKVYAVDIVPAFLGRIASRATRARLGNVFTVAGGERSAQLPDASIDVAFLCDVYHHLEYPAPYLASLGRALKPGGRLVLVELARIPGVTKPAVLEHVRAGQAEVVAELSRAGFVLARTLAAQLRENYMLEFKHDSPP